MNDTIMLPVVSTGKCHTTHNACNCVLENLYKLREERDILLWAHEIDVFDRWLSCLLRSGLDDYGFYMSQHGFDEWEIIKNQAQEDRKKVIEEKD